MATTIFILAAVFLLGLGITTCFLWLLGKQAKGRQNKEEVTTAEPLTLHLSFIILPLVLLMVSIVLTIFFYRLLPTEVAYRFELDGSPGGFLSRGQTILLLLTPQLLLALSAWGITWGVIRLGFLSRYRDSLLFEPERVLALMGNMLAIPQAILCFATLDIFSYNAYQVHIMPLWQFALIVLAVGTIILGIFSVPLVLKAWKSFNSQSSNNTKE